MFRSQQNIRLLFEGILFLTLLDLGRFDSFGCIYFKVGLAYRGLRKWV